VISFHTNPRLLATVPVLVFLGLTAIIAVVPALQLREAYPASTEEKPDAAAVEAGRRIYVREGCMYCHTQQVRSDPRMGPGEDGGVQALPQDARYGRASLPGDFADDDPPLLGSQRVGPDLSNVGARLPSREWHLLHLYSPRAVSGSSVMPAYRWYFRGKDDKDPGTDVRIPLTNVQREAVEPDPAKRRQVEIWATPDAQNLVKYLLSLRQTQAP
jgi:cytochrome c oxidase cbb3-type subunit 2